MKSNRRNLILATLLGVATSCAPPPEPGSTPDTPTASVESPEPTARTPENWRIQGLLPDSPLALSDLRGHVVLIDYWSSHSVPSRVALRDLATLQSNHQEKGFAVLSVCLDTVDDPDELRQRLATLELPYPVGLAGPESALALGGIRVIPSRYLIDREGRLRETYAGAVPLAEIEADLLRLLR